MKKIFLILLTGMLFCSNCLIWFTGGNDSVYGNVAQGDLEIPALFSYNYKVQNSIPFQDGNNGFLDMIAPVLILKADKFYYKKDIDNCANLIYALPTESTLKIVGAFCHFN